MYCFSTDTDNNAADFVASGATPRNSATISPCGSAPVPTAAFTSAPQTPTAPTNTPGFFSSAPNSESSICFCTTVPCPESGNNFLDIGGTQMTSRYSNNVNGNLLIREASYTVTSATFGTGGDTTTCTRAYARNYDDDGTKVWKCSIQNFLD